MSFWNVDVLPKARAQTSAVYGLEQSLNLVVRLLITKGLCDESDIARGRCFALEEDQRLDLVLVKAGIITEKELAYVHAEFLGVPVIGQNSFPLFPILSERLRPIYLHNARICPLSSDGVTLVLAVADVLDEFTPRAVAAAVAMQVRLVVALPIDLEAALHRLYPDKVEEKGSTAQSSPERGGDEDSERIRDLTSDKPIIRLVNQIISRAVETNASDIHVEPLANRLRVRYRYDGVLQDVDAEAVSLAPAIISRLKVMAKLDIAETRVPQDGRIKLVVRGTEVEFRVSTIPSHAGETIVLRILNRNAVSFSYHDLGLSSLLETQWRAIVEEPNGLVLVTGPTGSGKTTTLYTAISGLDRVGRKIVTLENPVEYTIDNVTQIQVKPQLGLDFPALLRSTLRQDPDVIMVGEVRDMETAQVAAHAALTGHLILSTIHTNSASATVTRLRDLKIEDAIIASTLRGVLAQRLVRRLCERCKSPVEPSRDMKRYHDLYRLSYGRQMRVWEPIGCAHCRNSGYKGRQAIVEVLQVSTEIRHLIHSGGSESQIEALAIANGMIPISEVGIKAVLSGITSLSELEKHLRFAD